MTLGCKSVIKITFAAIALTVSGLIYVIFRPKRLIMFDWFRFLKLESAVAYLRESFDCSKLCPFVVNNLPAGLWLLSYMIIIDTIWDDAQGQRYLLFLVSLPLFAFLSEALQLIGMLTGTFDIFDVVSYVVSIIVFITIKRISKWY